MRQILVSSYGAQSTIAPTRAGPWGLYVYPRRSGAGNERILCIQDDEPQQVLALPTGMVFQNLTAKYLRITGVERTLSNLNGSTQGGLPAAPDQGGSSFAESPLGSYSIIILENGETMAPVHRNLKIPRYSIVNTGTVANTTQLLQNPNSLGGAQNLTVSNTTFGPYDLTLFDNAALTGQFASFVGGSSPSGAAYLLAGDVSGSGMAAAGYQTQIGSATSVGPGSYFALPLGVTVQSQSSGIWGISVPQVSFSLQMAGAPTSGQVYFDFEAR